MKGKKRINKVIKGLKKASKTHAAQAKSLEGVTKMKLGGMGVLKAARDAGIKPQDMSVVGALRKNPDSFKYLGLGGAALSKLLRERGGEMQAKEEEVMQNPRNVPVQPGVATAPRMMKEGGKVKK